MLGTQKTRVIFGIFMVCLGAHSGPADDGLRYFLASTMYGFQDWIIREGLDPTPPLDRNITISISMSNRIFTLDGEIGNISNLGLSARSSGHSFHGLSFTDTKVDFWLSVATGGLSGNYNATGAVLGSYPIGGNSWWRLTSTYTNIRFREKFYVEDGYIRLNDSYWSTSEPEIFFKLEELTGSFNGLLTPDTEQYEGHILRTIAEHIERSTRYENLLFYPVLYRYLQEAFSATPVDKIITWPEPLTTSYPPSTTGLTTPSTTPPTTPSTTPPTTPPTSPTTTNRTTTTDGYTPCSHLDSITSEGMNNFLLWSLNSYPQYLINNGLDPTRPLINPMALHVNSSFLRLDGTFRNTAGSNMSRGLFVQNVESEFLTSSFSVELYFPRVALNSAYEAVGEIVSIYPISGLGNWQIRDFSLGLTIRISGFAIEDGYINIQSYSNREIVLIDPVSDVENNVLFPDLVTPNSADGLGIEVLGILGDAVPEMLEREVKHPIVNSVLEYLQFKFSNTPITEIIGTTRPPC